MLHAVIEPLRTAGFDPCVVEIPDGERFKALGTESAAYDQPIDAQLDRGSAIGILRSDVSCVEAVSNRHYFSHDRKRDLFRPDGAHVQSNRRVDA